MTEAFGRRAFLRTSAGLFFSLTTACATDRDEHVAQEGSITGAPPDEDSYEAWLRYRPLDAAAREAAALLAGATVEGQGSVLESAREELRRGLSAMLGGAFDPSATDVGLVAGTPETSELVRSAVAAEVLARVGPEGFVLTTARVGGRSRLVLASNGDRGVLYGVFRLLRMLQTRGPLVGLADAPAMKLRMIQHWDNWEGGAERGYAGPSVFDFPAFPKIEERYVDYARMLASIGVNACAINNVNASVKFLDTPFLQSLAPLAKLFEAWGIRLFLSANYAAPMLLGGLDTADPFDARVIAFWDAKVAEIHRLVPNFGGFLVKANSERERGPLDFGATHADGANLLARALAKHGDGLVVWRAFVWKHDADRAKYAYNVFQPLDGAFDPNVIVQIKNGPIDFQVREPVHPLFGRMPKTQPMLELQITQEYTGQSTHLCHLVPQWKEVLTFDTRANGPGGPPATVADILRGRVFEYRYSGIAGVRNVGRDRNWTGHPLAAANLYGFGRLAWDPDLASETIAEEWTRMTFGNDPTVVGEVVPMLLRSWAVYESYTSPLGSTFMCEGWERNFDPLPETKWNQYYHRADDFRTTTDRPPGVGFDRVQSGYTRLYHPEVAARFESLATCPEELLLFFHHVPYEHRLSSGKTVIQHIYDTHFDGVEEARRMRERWSALAGRIDRARHAAILERFDAQVAHAESWRDSIVSFFFHMSGVRDALREWVAVRRIRMPDEVEPGVVARVSVDVANATTEPAEIAVRVSEPAEWSGGGKATLPPLTSSTFEIDVTPAAGSTPVFEVVATTASGKRPAVLGPRIAQYINKHGGLRAWRWP